MTKGQERVAQGAVLVGVAGLGLAVRRAGRGQIARVLRATRREIDLEAAHPFRHPLKTRAAREFRHIFNRRYLAHRPARGARQFRGRFLGPFRRALRAQRVQGRGASR